MDTHELAAFSTLVEHIYQGATEPDAWATIPQAIAQWMQSPKATLFTPLNTPDQGGFVRTHDIDAHAIELWGTRYLTLDPWAARVMSGGLYETGAVFRDQELLPAVELVQTEFYKEFLQRMDVGRMVSGVVFGLAGQTSPADMLVSCTCHRQLNRPYEDADVFRMRLLLPHLSRALGVMFRLRRADFRLECSLAALDLMPQAALLLERGGAVAHANPAAQQMLERNDGLALVARMGGFAQGVLRCTHPDDHKALTAAIDSALQPDALHATHFGQAVQVRRPSGAPALAVRVSSLAAGNEFGRGLAQTPMAIAFINDGEASAKPDLDLLRARYGLTQAEARVAEASSLGLPIQDMATMLGIGVPTVKTHLARVYAKTRTNGRAQLMRLLLATSEGASARQTVV